MPAGPVPERFALAFTHAAARMVRGRRHPLPPPGGVSSILVLADGMGLGDSVLALPLFHALRKGCPRARIVLATSPGIAAWLKASPDLDGTRGVDGLPPDWEGLDRADWAIDLRFDHTTGSARCLRRAGARCTIGFDLPLRGAFFDLAIPVDYRREHHLQAFHRMASALELPWDGRIRLPRSAEGERRALAVLAEHGLDGEGPLVLLHPGGRHDLEVVDKRWPVGRYAELGRRLAAQGNRVALVGTASERALCAQASAQGGLPSLAGETDFAALTALVSRASLLVGNNSGPLHVAAALGIPTISFSGGIHLVHWRPLGGRARVLLRDAACHEALCRPCPDKGEACLGRIPVERVLRAASGMLQDAGWKDPEVPLPGVLPAREPAARILVLMTSGIGDLLCGLPFLREIRHAHPSARLDVLLAEPSGTALLAGECDRVLLIPQDWLVRPGSFLKALRVVLRGRGGCNRYDLAVAPAPGRGLGLLLLALASGARCRLGLRFLVGPWEAGWGWTRVEPTGPDHVMLQNRRILLRLGIQPAPRSSAPAIPEESRRRARALLEAAGLRPEEPLLAVQVGSGPQTFKRWLPERFARVLRRMAEDFGARPVLLGTPSEVPLAREILREAGPLAVDLSGKTDLMDALAVLSFSRLFLGNDGALMHAASALGVPVVALFGPTDPAVFGPAGGSAPVRLVSLDLPCRPCYHAATPGGVRCPIGFACVRDLGTDAVLEALVAAWKDAQAGVQTNSP